MLMSSIRNWFADTPESHQAAFSGDLPEIVSNENAPRFPCANRQRA